MQTTRKVTPKRVMAHDDTASTGIATEKRTRRADHRLPLALTQTGRARASRFRSVTSHPTGLYLSARLSATSGVKT